MTLPYSFRQLPSSLPPSIVEDSSTGKPKYITSASGHTAHPEDIIASCTGLEQHIAKTKDEAKRQLEEWEQSIKDKELAEKRRVAPGWLDRDEKILEPMKPSTENQDLLDTGGPDHVMAPAMSPSKEGEAIDQVFGKMAVK